MKKFFVIASIASLSACATTTTTSFDPGAAAPFVGKTLTTEDGSTTFLFLPGGTVGGNTRNGDEIVGTYFGNGDQVCSSYSAPAALVDLGQICSTPEVNGDKVQFLRTNGTKSPVYNITG